jgi:hypothetical protein
MTTTFYRDDSVHINSTAIRVGDEWYPLSSLRYVWHRRTGRLRRGGYMLLTRGAAVALVVGLLVGGGIAARRIDFTGKTMVIAGGILALIVVGGIAAFAVEYVLELVDRTHEHGRGIHEIWVRGDHGDFLLYSTSDSIRFGQIYRALQRAIEAG